MNNLWPMLKIQLLGFYGINKAFHSRDIKEKRKNRIFLAGAVLIVLLFCYLSFLYSYMMSLTFAQFDMMDMLLAIMMAVTSVVIIFFSFIQVSGTLFAYKDYDMVMSLPVRINTIVMSRVLIVYFSNIAMALIIMIPAAIVYVIKVLPGPLFYLYFLLSVFFIPVVPIIIATVLGALVSFIASFFKKSNLFALILSLLMTIAIVALSMSSGTMADADKLADIGKTLTSSIYKIYPLTKLYVQAVCAADTVSLLTYIGASVILLVAFSYILAIKYKAINTALMTHHTRSNYRVRELKQSAPVTALFHKELGRYFSSTIYVMNTGIGMVLMLAATLALMFVEINQLEVLLEIPGFAGVIGRILPLAVSLLIVMSSTTASAISMEGKNLWVVKSLPVSNKVIFDSKLLVNLLVLIPAVILSAALLAFRFKTDILQTFLLFLIPILYSFFISLTGLFANLLFPKFDWTTETQPVKSGVSVLICMLAGFASVAIPLVLVLFFIDLGTLIMLILALVLLLIDLLLYRLIHTKGSQLFDAL